MFSLKNNRIEWTEDIIEEATTVRNWFIVLLLQSSGGNCENLMSSDSSERKSQWTTLPVNGFYDRAKLRKVHHYLGIGIQFFSL